MCGIFGFVDFGAGRNNELAVKKALDSLKHRGPDDEDVFREHTNSYTVVLGHRRLSIIDIKGGRQPMSNENGDIVLVCNGEIYNYRELRKELLGKGHNFKTESDSEVIIHLYEEHGKDCVNYLIGMFALVIWDKARKQLFIARDRLGKKPLFYYIKDGKKLVFASEIAALLEYGEIERDVNKNAIYQYMSYSYISAPSTVFKKINKLEPAHRCIFSDLSLNKDRYWQLDFEKKKSIGQEEAVCEISRLMRESVSLRMISDVPVGAFLSGGIDSTIVTGIMSEKTHLPVETYSVGFEEDGFSELKYAGIVARHFGCHHHEIIMKPDSITRLPELIRHFGEPHADSSALATAIMAQEAKKKITVALVGEGSDELFAGYKRHLYYRIGRILNKLSIVSDNHLHNEYKRWMGIFSYHSLEGLLRKDFLSNIQSDSIEPSGLFLEASKFKDIDAALFVDTMFFLPSDLLTKLDISTMSFGLEARAPFLDHRLVEFAAALAPNLKLKGMKHKYILKRAFSDLIPAEIINRKKTGFVVPVASWFRSELKDYAREVILSDSARKRGYFNMSLVEKLIDDHINCRANFGHRIWLLLVLELWHQIFIDQRL